MAHMGETASTAPVDSRPHASAAHTAMLPAWLDPASAVVGGLIVFVIQSYISTRIKHKSAVRLAEHKKRHEAFTRVRGMLAQVDHCMDHLSQGHQLALYRDKSLDWSRKVRDEAREHTLLI